MAKYSKYNFVYLMQKWMDSVAGQTFMNYAYSWGASIVILGTLFKLTHLPGANLMLFIGMGTEVFVFFIAAFDRPFDKTADGRDLATDTELAATWGAGYQARASDETAPVRQATPVVPAEPSSPLGGTGGASPTPAPAVTPETAAAMEEATTTYVDRLNELNEMLLKVAAQSERLTTDSEEMENLNRTLTGISRVYEMLLKTASQQMTTQDEINDRTRQLATQMKELNGIYQRMIEAMKPNA